MAEHADQRARLHLSIKCKLLQVYFVLQWDKVALFRNENEETAIRAKMKERILTKQC